MITLDMHPYISDCVATRGVPREISGQCIIIRECIPLLGWCGGRERESQSPRPRIIGGKVAQMELDETKHPSPYLISHSPVGIMFA